MIITKCNKGCSCEAGYAGEVYHCPLHAAAWDMREALNDLCNRLSGCSMDYLYKHNLTLPLSKGQKALLKAEG